MLNKIKSLLELIPEEAECLYCIINDPQHYIPLIEEEWVENIFTFDTGANSYLRFCFPLSYAIKTEIDINSLSTLINPKLIFILKWNHMASINSIKNVPPRQIRTKNGDQNIKIYSFNL